MDEIELRSTLAMNIKKLRSNRNWTQADLAEKAGLSIVYLSDIERCNKWPYLDTMMKLAEVFKIEVYELLKPDSASSIEDTAILIKYTEEVKSILSKSFENTEKNISKTLLALLDNYQESRKKKR